MYADSSELIVEQPTSQIVWRSLDLEYKQITSQTKTKKIHFEYLLTT